MLRNFAWHPVVAFVFFAVLFMASAVAAHGADFRAEAKARTVPKTFEGAGGNVRYKEYPGVDHNCWTPTYADKEVLKWFFGQRKP